MYVCLLYIFFIFLRYAIDSDQKHVVFRVEERVTFAYPIKLNISTKNAVTKILGKKI